jgi:DNA (cytosine-5)-methyltransferase 1
MKHKIKTIEKFKNGIFFREGGKRLILDKPAPTLVPGHSNFPIHPTENRLITIREGAIITGFPIDYKFIGSHTNRCIQIGNAIPVQLAEYLAINCKKFLS